MVKQNVKQFNRTNKIGLWTAIIALFVSSFASANSGITYHGRILRPDETPVNSSTVQFRIQIRTPGSENCLLWQEQQTKDLSNTNGIFSITIADTSEPSLIPNALPYSLDRVFSNRSNFSSLTNCSVGSTYNPTGSDGRNLLVEFREGSSGSWETMPMTKINFVPLALNSLQVGGYQASEFLKIDPASSYTTLTPTQVNTLMDIIAGTNTQYLRSSTTFSGDVSGNYNTMSVDKIKGISVSSTAPTNGQVLKLVGGVWTPAADDNAATPGDASYSVKGVVQINTDLATSGLYINSGVLALPNVITAGGPIGGASSVPVITYDSKGRLTAVSSATVDDTTKLPLAGGTMTGSINMGTQNITNATSIASTNVSTRNVILADNDTNTVTIKAPADVTTTYNFTLPPTGGTSGYVLSTDGSGGTSWVAQSTSGVTSAAYAADVAPAASCTTSQTPYWNTVSDTWACQNIKVTGAGAFITDGGNTLGAAATIGTNDSNALSFETNNTARMTILDDGKIGIGTATPSSLLEVNKTGVLALNVTGTGGNEGLYVAEIKNNGSGQTGTLTVSNASSGLARALRVANTDASNIGHAVEIVNNSATGWSIYSYGTSPSYFAGNIGVGTDTPTTALDITGAFTQRGMAAPAVSATGQGRIYFDSTSNKFRVSENGGAYTDLLTTLTGTGAFIDGGNTFTAAATLGTNSNHALKFETNGTDKMTILTDGKVGIGTAAPTSLLEVAGDVTLSSAATRTIALAKPAAGAGGAFVIQGADGATTSNAGGSLKLAAGNGYAGRAGASILMGGSGFNGGDVKLIAGTSDTNGGSGSVTIEGGANGANGVGGHVYIKGGVGGVNVNNGGDVYIFGGAPGGAASYGNVALGYDGSTARGFVGVGTPTPTTALDVNGAVTHRGIASPAVAPAGQGRIYFDSTSNTYKVSQNGGAYSDLVTTGSTSFLTTSAYAADITPAASCTTTQTPYWNTVSDTWACQNINFSAGGGYINGGNSFAAAATIGTNDNNTFAIKTNNTNRMTFLTDGTINMGDGPATTSKFLHIKKDINSSNDGIMIQTTTGAPQWYGPFIYGRNTAGTFATPTSNADDNFLFGIEAQGYYSSNTTFGQSSQILFRADGNTGWLSFPGKIEFRTTPSGSNAVSTRMTIRSTGYTGIGTGSPAGRLDVSGNQSVAASATGKNLAFSTFTLTDSGTAASGTAAANNINTIDAPTLAATNTGVTTTDSATLQIKGPPIKGTNNTVTNAVALDIASGTVGAQTNSYGLRVAASTGATNNYAATFNGGYVGIGTTAPSAALEVAGQIKMTGGSPGAGKVLQSNASGLATWVDPSTLGTQITITNVKYGTVTQYNACGTYVQGLCNGQTTCSYTGNNANCGGDPANGQAKQITVAYSCGSTALIKVTSENIVTPLSCNQQIMNGGNSFGTSISIGSVDSNAVNFVTNGSNVMTISSAGLVGLGTTSPSERLHVVGNILVDGGNVNKTAKISSNASTSTLNISQNDNGNTVDLNMIVSTSAAIRFNGTDRLKVYSDGKVSVGVTTPTEMLEVNGNVKATGFISTSDARLKTNVKPISGLASILKLQGVQYNWIDSGEADAGVLAQEVEKVFPEAVRTNSQTGYKGVKYQYLIAPLIESTKDLYGLCKMQDSQLQKIQRGIASLQEQGQKHSTDIEILKKENQLLKNENTNLKKRLEKIEKALGIQ